MVSISTIHLQETTETGCPENADPANDESGGEKSGDKSVDAKEGAAGGNEKEGEDKAPIESDGASKSGWLHAASKSLSLSLHLQTLRAHGRRVAEKVSGLVLHQLVLL